MKTKTSKRQTQITRLVERGYDILLELIFLNNQFKYIQEQLKAVAVARRAEHLPIPEKDSEGTQWIETGAVCQCRIVFPEAKVKTDFDPQESDFLTIRSLAGDHFNSLFREVTLYRPAAPKTFRSQVNDLLAPKVATELLELCMCATEPQTLWKTLPVGKEQS
jgi:hypothetical protein